VACIKR